MTRPAFRTLTPQVPEQAAVRRLLQRVGLGARPGETEAAARNGFDATLAGLASPAGRDAGVAATPPPALAPPQRKAAKGDTEARTEQRQEAARQTAQLGTWWLDRMAAADEPLPERMTWFWHGHFATSAGRPRRPGRARGRGWTRRQAIRVDRVIARPSSSPSQGVVMAVSYHGRRRVRPAARR